MDIIVEGRASDFFKPDLVKIDLNFYTKTLDYKSALEKGALNVEKFINDVLTSLNLKKEELKTRSFNVREEVKYDYDKKQNYKDGFSYSQSATLEFDYNMEILSKFMEITSKLDNPPKYIINFKIKNEEKVKSLVIAKAFSKAEEKAKMIALAAGKRLKECIKVDFRPFEENVISNSNLNAMNIEKSCFLRKETNISETIQKVFTPEDVEVSETLYCLWITE